MAAHLNSGGEPTWGLEYLLLFGPPENKIELLGGYTPCAFPFASREAAQRHFTSWAEQITRLCRLTAVPRARTGPKWSRWKAKRFTMTLHKRPIHLRVPVPTPVYHWAHSCFFRRDLWGPIGVGRRTGWWVAQDHWDVKHNVWRLFEDASDRLPGWGIGGVDVSLSGTDSIVPDHSFYRGGRGGVDFAERTIGGQYFKGPPDLIVEVFSDYSRPLDRGPRMEVCRRNGVPHLWHLDPVAETLEAYELRGGEYDRVATLAGEMYRPDAFPELMVDVAGLFDTQSKRHGDRVSSPGTEPEEPPQEWGVPEEERVGLEHLLLLGHAERRREIWDNRAPCRLAFASEREASTRLASLLADAAAWEGEAAPSPVRQVEPGIETAEVGRFRFVRRGRCVHLDLAVDGMFYRQLLHVCADRSAWDWGD